MKSKLGILFLVLGALIAMSTAIAHLSCIYFGSACYKIQMAPNFIVESAKNGTLVAPLGAVVISSFFIVFGLYALSAAGLIRQLPFLKFGVYSIAIVSIVRGILPLQLWLRKPETVNNYVFNAGIIWLIAGLFYLFGYLFLTKKPNENKN